MTVYILAPKARSHMGTCSLCFGNDAAAITTFRKSRRRLYEVPLGWLLVATPDMILLYNAFGNLRWRRAAQISSTSSRFYSGRSYVSLSLCSFSGCLSKVPGLLKVKRRSGTHIRATRPFELQQAPRTCRKSCVFLMFQQKTMQKKRRGIRGSYHASG